MSLCMTGALVDNVTTNCISVIQLIVTMNTQVNTMDRTVC